MEKLIPVINQLQDVFTAVGTSPIDLPQIVVIGSQSSGKSSVLESIVGKDFLPRGIGICTRRPLVLQLVHTSPQSEDAKADSDAPEEFGVFLHQPDRRMDDFHEIRAEIAAETERVVGSNKGISSKPINLKIFSPKVLNLTLVDLPGITKVAVGDQPEDIENQIREMVLHYISNPNSVILAVTPANTDLATSDALQMAREVDQYGLRTLGVITKIDLMDHGCNAADMLQGKVVPLKLGYIGVKNRSQLDIQNNVTIETALEQEAKFFRQHPTYRSISTRLGTPYLATCLNRILMHHIRETLPGLKAQVNSMVSELQRELQQYGDPVFSQKSSQGALLLHILSKFSTCFCDAIDGRGKDASATAELYGGARISFIFHGIYARGISEINPFDELTDQDIRTAIRNATGPRPSLFVPEISFEILSKTQIQRLREPSLQCVDLVFDELQRISMQCETPEVARFETLRDKIVDCINSLLRSHREPTKHMVANLIDIELSYINTNHPDFIGGSRAVSSTLDSMKREQQRNKENAAQAAAAQNADELKSAHPSHPSQSHSSGDSRGQSASQASHGRDRGRSAAQRGSGHRGDAQNGADDRSSRHSRHQGAPNGDGSLFNQLFGKNKNDRSGPGGASQSAAGGGSHHLHQAPSHSQGNSMPNGDPNNPPVQSQAVMSSQGGAAMNGAQDPQEQGRKQYPMYADNQLLSKVPPSVELDVATDREQIETQIIKTLISSYFAIVRKNVLDSIPKAIMHFLVNQTKTDLQSELVTCLYKDELFDSLLQENNDIAQKRTQCTELLDVLNRALAIVNSVRDLKV